MRNIILAGVAAIAVATVPALAQDSDDTANTSAAPQASGTAPAPRSAEQANEQAQPAPPTTTVVPAASGASAVVTTFPGNDTGPPAASLNKHYPVCSRKLQDNCQNPGEGGAPGRSRALPYWPGHPASEK